MTKTGAVIVAAGLSSRMGVFKPLLKLGSMPLIGRVIANFQQAGVFPIVVVTGFRAAELEKQLAKLNVICVRNEAYAQTEMFTSALRGFQFIKDKCDRVFFTPADIPLFTCQTLRRLLATDAEVAKPVCAGRGGHPLLLQTRILDKLAQYQGSGGLRGALAPYGQTMELVAVADEGILIDVDTPGDYQYLVQLHNRTLFRPLVEVALMREGRLFDQDAAMLLQLVAYSGTVKEACERIGISYSKGWKLLASLEANLGFPLLERQPGGESGGTSILTKAGADLLASYEAYLNSVRNYAEQHFQDFFPENVSRQGRRG